jgi:PAS domain S-box-containing protein
VRRQEAKGTGQRKSLDPTTFQAFLDAAPDAIVVTDPRGRIVYANASTERLFGYSSGELLDQTVEVLVPRRLHKAHVAQRTRYQEAPASRPMGLGLQLVGLHKSGTEIPVEISLSAVATPNGTLVMSAIRDLRERMRAEAERERLQAQIARQRHQVRTTTRQFERASKALRALVDLIPAGVLMADANGEIVLSNAAANEILGGTITGTAYGPSTRYTLHRPDGSAFPPEDLPLARAIDRGETTRDAVILVRYENGIERTFLGSGAPERDENGKIVGAVAVMYDVTERERAELIVREQGERLRLITHSSPDTMFFQDRELRFQWVVNPVPPFTEDVMLQRTDFELLPEEQAVPLVEIKKRVMNSRVGARTTIHRVRNGVDHYYEIVLEPRRDDQGNVEGIFGYARDVTEQKLAEEELARLNRTIELERSQLATILDSATNAIIYIDAATGYVRANPEAEVLLGHPIVPGSGRGQYLGQIRYPDGHLVPLPDLPASRALRGETPGREENLIYRPDGSKVPVLANAAPVRTPDGKIVGAVVVIQDISAIKELERVREEWTSVIAHDLRQPVTVISGYAGLVAKDIPPSLPRVQARVGHILSSSSQLNRMIEDLLDVSRLESRRLQLRRQTTDLPLLIRDVVDRAAEQTKGHDVSVTLRGSIPVLELDPGRIEQVLVNLLSNAAKYGDEGTPIAVEVEDRKTDVLVSVSNQGPGIKPDELRSLFTRFYRTQAAQSGSRPGIGLGLYISKGLVEAHGGRMWAESTPGKTTTFHFTLPLQPSKSAP